MYLNVISGLRKVGDKFNQLETCAPMALGRFHAHLPFYGILCHAK